ncbi:hypothetical protein OS493_022022 [Desmophyllum pertusum]|uniref:Uncharacterized protein n=1 Tax=Desmophyllum pertusum TaxID=174260 RepID=A0A9X0CSJ9_9CNID|nr:hypothetical protein OS493_022022 [Desmophyllum pertusum]
MAEMGVAWIGEGHMSWREGSLRGGHATSYAMTTWKTASETEDVTVDEDSRPQPSHHVCAVWRIFSGRYHHCRMPAFVCIVKYLQSSYHCPVCDAEVHKTKPLLHIRPDRTLQEIVFKLVPGLYQAELKLRQDLEEKQQEENTPPDEKGVANEMKDKKEVEMEDPVCITLEYYRRKRNWLENQIFPTRYLRCPSAVTVNVLKKFLITKFAIPNTHQSLVDLEYAFLRSESRRARQRPRQENQDILSRKKNKIRKK